MKCAQVLSVLSRFQDNECDPQTASAIRRHLKGCERCRGELEWMNQMIKELKGIDEAEPSPGFTATVMGNLPPSKSPLRNPLPSFVYPAVFIFFFVLGLLVTPPVKTDNKTVNREITLVQLLMESQNLNHFSAQKKTIELIDTEGLHGQ